MATVTILGSGLMGSAIAWPLSDNGRQIRLTDNFRRRTLMIPRALLLIGVLPFLGLSPAWGQSPPGGSFWAPPSALPERYTIDCRIDPETGTLTGTEIIRVTNNTRRPIQRLALNWSINPGQPFAVKSRQGPGAALAGGGAQESRSAPLPIELSRALKPGEALEMELQFTYRFRLAGTTRTVTMTRWHPRLWWGFPTHAQYDVKLETPAGYVLGSSGCRDPKTGRYRADNVRSFGLILGKDLQVIETMAGDVQISGLHTAKGAECAKLLVDTAVDVINFYRERFGFYPHRSLTIIPGGDYPAGGYPVATAMVAIHGQERFGERKDTFWRWITAHEIGHEYWSEHVLSADPDELGWLMVGLGIFADREYCRARGIQDRHKGFFDEYANGVRKGVDTTIDRTEEQKAEIKWDFNNIVVHGKGFSVISALATTVGKDAFDRAYRRCLREYAGRRLDPARFRTIAEEESGQNLDWFFEQWVRSSRYPSCRIVSQEMRKEGNGYLSTITVECIGTLKMPVPVGASFEDGTRQVQATDRLAAPAVLRFRSASPLKEVRLDPDGEIALVVPPPELSSQELSRRVDALPWSGVGKEALELYKSANEIDSKNGEVWGRLGLALYDGRYYPEALEAFRRAAPLIPDKNYSAVAIIWQGHVLDLLGRRQEAIAAYRQALETNPNPSMQHDQYGMRINRQWVEERIQKPFDRR